MTHNNQEELREELIAVYYKDFNDYNDIDVKFEDVYEFIHHQLQKARQEERERAIEIIKDELRDAPLEIQMTKGIIFASIIGRIVDPT